MKKIFFAIIFAALTACAAPASQPPTAAPAATNAAVSTTAGSAPRPAETRAAESAPTITRPVTTSATRVPGTIYVAPNGNDAWSGKLPAPNASNTDGPFATFEHARVQVQSLDKTGLKQVTIQFRAGTYYLAATQHLTGDDSGSADTPIVYENYPGESPIISGGVRVQNWTNVNGNLWRASLPASTRYFENLYYNGVRRLRPRLGGYLGAYLRITSPVYLNVAPPPAIAPEPNCPIYVTGKGWECFDRFQYNPTDPISNTWQNLAPPAGNPCGQPAGNPALIGDVELLDFEKFSASNLRISCIDTASHIVYLTGPTLMNAGFYTALGFILKHRYLIENVHDRLTQPGQWFLDRSTTPWTLTYLPNGGENPNTDTVIIPQLAQILVASNLEYVTFQGLTFSHDNYTIPLAGHSTLDLHEEIPAALSFQNSRHISLDSNIVAHTSAPALEFISCTNTTSASWCISRNANAVTANNAVKNNAFYDLASTSVRIGMPGRAGDTDANLPQFNIVENNVVEGYGRVFPNSFGISQGEGHDNTYMHNDVYDGYHAAIGICLCAGRQSDSHDNIISFNHVYNLHQGIMNDGGAIYIQTGNLESTAPSGNKMLNNKVHDVSDASALDEDGYGGDGLYVDNTSGSIDVENNLVYRVSGAAMNFAEAPGAPNEATLVKNNILAFARVSMINVGNPYWDDKVPPTPIQVLLATNNLFYFDRSTASSPSFHVQGGCTYSGGFAYPSWQQWNSNLYWRTDGKFAGDAQAFHVQPSPATNNPCFFGNNAKLNFFPLSGWQKIGEDMQSVVQNPGFANAAWPADDYSLPGGSPGKGFVVFDPDQAGRSNPVIRPPAVPATFQTKTFNPATDF
jgi:hypothetical protein